MIKITHLLLAGAVALAFLHVSRAQEASPQPPAGASGYRAAPADPAGAPHALPEALPAAPAATPGGGGAILPSLPQPRDLPASLFAPPAQPVPGFIALDVPYFVSDPLLDGRPFPAPGWFAGAEIQVLKPHLLNRLSDTVQNPAQRTSGTSTTVALPNAVLNWTVSPRVFIGYRLPSGFGELLVAYRHLGSEGSMGIPGANGPTGLNTRLGFDMIDLDYNSRELSLWPKWDMRWTLGARLLDLFYDSRVDQSFTQAAAGNGIIQARASNNLFGAGPHAALELARHLGESRWSFYFRADIASVFYGTHEGFLTRSATLGPDGQPLTGAARHFGTQDAPILNIRTGLTWKQSPSSATRLFLGYQYEYFWALDRLPPTGNNPPSLGQLWDQGVVLQATINY
jgi:hypothetical protein